MFNRLRRWFHRPPGGGAPLTPLSVQVSEPWTIDRIEQELRWQREERTPPYPRHPFFDHDSVQLAADAGWPDEYTAYLPTRGHRADLLAYDEAYDYPFGDPTRKPGNFQTVRVSGGPITGGIGVPGGGGFGGPSGHWDIYPYVVEDDHHL